MVRFVHLDPPFVAQDRGKILIVYESVVTLTQT